MGLGIGLGLGLGAGLPFGRGFAQGAGLGSALVSGLVFALATGLLFALVYGLVFGLVWGPFKRSAVSSRLTFVWPSTRRQLVDFLRRAVRGLGLGLLVVGLIFGSIMGLAFGLLTYAYVNVEGERPIPWFEVQGEALSLGQPIQGLGLGLLVGLIFGLILGLVFGLFFGLASGLLESRSVLITSRTPKETYSRSRIAALTWLASGLGGGLVVELGSGKDWRMGAGLGLGVLFALRNGGWFVLLQKVAHRRLARAGNLPPRPYDFLEWGIDMQIFRRVGGGVRFRHNLIQQQLAKLHQPQPREVEVLSETRGPKLALAGVFLALIVLDIAQGLWGETPYSKFGSRLAVGIGMALHDLFRLALIMPVVSGMDYLFVMRRQGVSFREAVFSWPMVAVAGVVTLLLLFTGLIFPALGG